MYLLFINKITINLLLYFIYTNTNSFPGNKLLLILNSKRCASNDPNVVSNSELNKLKNSFDVVIVDVRTKEEARRTGKVPDSLCVPCELSLLILSRF